MIVNGKDFKVINENLITVKYLYIEHLWDPSFQYIEVFISQRFILIDLWVLKINC